MMTRRHRLLHPPLHLHQLHLQPEQLALVFFLVELQRRPAICRRSFQDDAKKLSSRLEGMLT